jgi:hypothetical protein
MAPLHDLKSLMFILILNQSVSAEIADSAILILGIFCDYVSAVVLI